MTREQARFKMSQIPTDTMLAVANAKQDIENGVAKEMMLLPLEETFGRVYAQAYCRYVDAYYTMEEFGR